MDVATRGLITGAVTRGDTGLAAVDGRLQAAHLSGPRSDPDAASSGTNHKAPALPGDAYWTGFPRRRAIGKPTLTDDAPLAAGWLGLGRKKFAAVREISPRLTLPQSKLHNTRHPDHIIAFDEPE
jgi:hypothetical protein